MVDIYKNLDRFFYSMLATFFLCSINFLGTMAETSYYENGNQLSKARLRGEVWYGHASWYGGKFQGRKTSNGEKYNKRELTAAHNFLPFNTHVLVTNLQNNKSVVVRINDRGPFKGGRIIDLSEEAAKLIDGKKQGITYVKVQVLPYFRELAAYGEPSLQQEDSEPGRLEEKS